MSRGGAGVMPDRGLRRERRDYKGQSNESMSEAKTPRGGRSTITSFFEGVNQQEVVTFEVGRWWWGAGVGADGGTTR